MPRTAKTNEQKALAGTLRADRMTGELTSKQITVMPTAPKYFNKRQKEYFKSVAALLIDEKKLTVTNVHYVNLMAVNLYNVEKAVDEMNKTGEVIRMPSGYEQPSAWLKVLNAAQKNLVDIGKLFGFDPYSATKFKEVKNETENKLNEIINKYKPLG